MTAGAARPAARDWSSGRGARLLGNDTWRARYRPARRSRHYVVRARERERENETERKREWLSHSGAEIRAERRWLSWSAYAADRKRYTGAKPSDHSHTEGFDGTGALSLPPFSLSLSLSTRLSLSLLRSICLSVSSVCRFAIADGTTHAPFLDVSPIPAAAAPNGRRSSLSLAVKDVARASAAELTGQRSNRREA